MNKMAIITIFGLVIWGCATRPLSNAEAKLVPIERILDASFIYPKPDTATITIKRDSGSNGYFCSSRVFVNKTPIADLNTSEKVVIYLTAGNYVISSLTDWACGGKLSEVQATVKSGDAVSYRIGAGIDGVFSINPTAF